jgi:hypothetical protein
LRFELIRELEHYERLTEPLAVEEFVRLLFAIRNAADPRRNDTGRHRELLPHARPDAWAAGEELELAAAVDLALQALDLIRGGKTGATGLEPATSGVTGRYGLDRYGRLRPGIAG